MTALSLSSDAAYLLELAEVYPGQRVLHASIGGTLPARLREGMQAWAALWRLLADGGQHGD